MWWRHWPCPQGAWNAEGKRNRNGTQGAFVLMFPFRVPCILPVLHPGGKKGGCALCTSACTRQLVEGAETEESFLGDRRDSWGICWDIFLFYSAFMRSGNTKIEVDVTCSSGGTFVLWGYCVETEESAVNGKDVLRIEDLGSGLWGTI